MWGRNPEKEKARKDQEGRCLENGQSAVSWAPDNPGPGGCV